MKDPAAKITMYQITTGNVKSKKVIQIVKTTIVNWNVKIMDNKKKENLKTKPYQTPEIGYKIRMSWVYFC